MNQEIIEHFEKRTNEHIIRVQKYATKLALNFDMLSDLINIVKKHDQSKFKAPEYDAYLSISWMYHCKREGIEFETSDDLKAGMLKATTHHVLTNAHHPEFWSDNRDPINANNRDKPKGLIDATAMPVLYLGEMVADWSAMSEEHGEDGPYGWAKDNINVRWKFTNEQIKKIYEYIDFLWKKKEV